MQPGMRTSSFPGSVDDAILELRLELLPGGGSGALKILPAAGYGARNYALYLNGRRERNCCLPTAGATLPLVLPAAGGSASVALEDLGDWVDAEYDPSARALDHEAATADRIHLNWNAPIDYMSRGSAAALAQLSNWAINGIKRFSNCAPIDNWTTRAELMVELIVAGAQRTVRLYSTTELIAEGSRSGDGSVTLAEIDSSGVSGAVTVAAEAGIAIGEYSLEPRYPRAYEIHYSTAALSFPRTAEQTVLDDGSSNVFSAVTAGLPAGTYNVALLPVSDTGIKPASATPQPVTLAGPPQPPANLAYDSGNAAATVIRWTASVTAGATYRIYDSAAGGVTRLDVIAATHAAGSGTLTQAMPAFTGPGLRRIIVRAVNNGFEEKNIDILEIEYDAGGNVLGKRPNSPRIQKIVVEAGRRIDVTALYCAAGQQQSPINAQLFVAAEDASIDYSAPAATIVWDAEIAGMRQAILSATTPADGWYKVAVRAAADDGTQDTGIEWERVHVTNAAPPPIGTVAAIPGRA